MTQNGSSLRRFAGFLTPSALAPDETDQDAPEGYRTDVEDFLSPDLPHPKLVEPDGIEPTTSCLQSTRSPN